MWLQIVESEAFTMNLIPTAPGSSPNYWCTWSTQNFGRDDPNPDYRNYLGSAGSRFARGEMNEKNLRRWVVQFPKIRGDLYLLLDDGWDVPYGVHPDLQEDRFGALAPDDERFPSFTGTSAQRLKKLNDFVKEFGWRGLGLWVPAQAAGSLKKGPAMEAYWTERLFWCKEAGVEYWKVDWGTYAHDVEYRLFLTQLAAKIYPQLIVEHAYCMIPYNGNQLPTSEYSGGRFGEMTEVAQKSLEIHQFSQVFRTYDTFSQMGTATTLDRAAHLLGGEGGLLTCEDNVRISASLGCTAGIMRSHYWNDIENLDYDSTLMRRQLDEVTAAVLWQRLAPAFSGGETACSEEILTDRWLFRTGECWVDQVFGQEIHQSAPAVIARNIPLPRVTAEKERPFITCAQHPNGALSVAAHRRLLPTRQNVLPLCSVTLQPRNMVPYLGVFGSFQQVTVQFPAKLGQQMRVLGQSLLAQEARDVTSQVRLSNQGELCIPGALLEELYRPTATPGDLSDPAVLFALIREPSDRAHYEGKGEGVVC